MADVDGLIALWFDGWSDDAPMEDGDPAMKRWFSKDPALDAELRRRFADDHLQAARRDLAIDSDAAAVANILLLDQIPRNIYRGTPHMFATDRLARNATRALLDAGRLEHLPFIHRQFVLMPLMHAEDLESHDLAVEQFTRLKEQTAHLGRAGTFAGALDYENRHRDIIVRFGRYPHRNAVLGRQSTAKELAFLEQPGSSF